MIHIAGGGSYAAIAGLTNILATLLAACIYEFFLVDSLTAITGFHMDFIDHNMKHGRMQRTTVTSQTSTWHELTIRIPRV